VRSGRSSIRAERPLEPEVLSPLPAWLERLGWLLDRSIPVGRGFSVGLDGLIGLIPGVGDLAGALLGLLIVGGAARAGVPGATLARMVVNVGLDALLGIVPIAGDVADFAFRSNAKNLAIFREALAGRRAVARDWAFVAGVVLALAAFLALPFALLFLLLRR
jgi:hypothetical protein